MRPPRPRGRVPPYAQGVAVTVEELPRTRSERALRASRGWLVILWVVLLGLQVAILVSGDVATTLHVVALGAYVFLVVVGLLEWRAPSAWRSAVLAPGERLLWGTSAARVLPGGGSGHDGVLVLTDRELRYEPRWTARLRGTHAESWPVASIGGVRVTPVDERRRRQGGRWVQVDVDGGPPVVVLTPETHLVADEVFTALHAQGLLPRP